MYGEPPLPPTGGGFFVPTTGIAVGGVGIVFGVEGAWILITLCSIALGIMIYAHIRLKRGEKIMKER
jgi:hypothetical protein